jgi:hypothetical protein
MRRRIVPASGQFKTNDRYSDMTASSLKADILLRLGGVLAADLGNVDVMSVRPCAMSARR